MVYERCNNVVKRQIAGETFLIPIRNRITDMRNIYVLHGIGEFIWDRLGVEFESICEDIVANYDVDKEQASRDLDEHLRQLVDAELITQA